MNQFKCRHCDKPAHFYFRESEGGMLCPDHSDLHCAAHVRDMMQRSRLSASPSNSRGEDVAAGVRVATGIPAVAANAGSPIIPGENATALALAGPQGLGGVVATISACCSLEGSGSASSDIRAGLDGTPAQERPSTFSDDLPIFPERRKATAFLVADSSLIQASASSSDILVQPSSVQV